MKYFDKGFWKMAGGFAILIVLGMGIVVGVDWYENSAGTQAATANN
jgi:hypothetical protein